MPNAYSDQILNCFGHKDLILTQGGEGGDKTRNYKRTTLFMGEVAAKVITVSSLIFALLRDVRSIK